MVSSKTAKVLVCRLAVALLLAALLPVGACSNEERGENPGEGSEAPTGRTEGAATPSAGGGGPETTANPPPEVTLGRGSEGPPEAVVRLEGDPKTVFTGLCSVGWKRSVLSGQVPKRFTFDLDGERLECRIEKRGGGGGDLKVVLVVGDTTRSVQQTNAPGGVVSLSYQGG